MGPGDPLGSRCQSGTDRLTKALLQGGDPQTPRQQACPPGWSLCWAAPTPCFRLSLCLIQQVQGPAEPALASAQPEKSCQACGSPRPMFQAALPPTAGAQKPHLSPAWSCPRRQRLLGGPLTFLSGLPWGASHVHLGSVLTHAEGWLGRGARTRPGLLRWPFQRAWPWGLAAGEGRCPAGG